jgi:hypothetical protein
VAATWGTDLLASRYSHDSAGRPLMFDLTLNVPVLLATLGLTLLTALVAGGIPAWQASRADLMGVLKDEGASGGARRARLRTLLVSAQIAVSVVLLVGATLLIGSAQRALQGSGFDPDQVITLRLRPSLVNYSRERAHAFQREVVSSVESLPGVISASPSVYMSIFSGGPRVAATNAARPQETVDAIGNPVGPRYFETIAVRLIEGREFREHDGVGAAPVVIVNEVLARRLWPDRPAVGLRSSPTAVRTASSVWSVTRSTMPRAILRGRRSFSVIGRRRQTMRSSPIRGRSCASPAIPALMMPPSDARSRPSIGASRSARRIHSPRAWPTCSNPCAWRGAC